MAISYYALGLATAAVVPLLPASAEKGVKSALVPVVILAVWWTLRRIKRRLEGL